MTYDLSEPNPPPPPRVTPEPDPDHGPREPSFFDTPPPVDVGPMLSLGWQTLRAGYGTILGAVLVVGAIQLIGGAIAGIMDATILGPGSFISPISTLFSLFVSTPLTVGLFMVGVGLTRRGYAQFDDLFSGFRRYGPVVLISLITTAVGWVATLSLALIVLPGLFSGTTVGLILALVGGLVWIVAMIYLSVRFWFGTMICVDPHGPRPGPIESLLISWRTTSGRALNLFAIALISSLGVLVTLLLLVLPGIFIGFPFAVAVGGATYAVLAHRTAIAPYWSYDACPHCGYSYEGSTSNVCTECGRERIMSLAT